MHILAKFGKRTLILSALLVSAQMYMSAAYSLVVHRIDGENETFLLEKKPVMTFNETDMLMDVEENVIAIPRADVENMNFTEVSGVKQSLDAVGNIIEVIDCNTFRINSALKTIGVFDMSGRSVRSAVTRIDGEYSTVSLASCPAGIYTITYNNKSIKIIKK